MKAVLTPTIADERYLAILSTPLLQNKLPEHIRERALLHKPALEKVMLEHFDGLPPFITSIE